MSLWADYHAETEGHSVIENEFGFARFHFAPPVCVVHDLFVAKEYRKQGKGMEIMNEVTQKAKEAGCTTLWSQVGLGTLCANESLKANLHYGFHVVSAQNGFIIMSKQLEGN